MHLVMVDILKLYMCHFRIFDLEQPSEPIIKFEGHTGGIKQVCEFSVSVTTDHLILTTQI